MGDLTLHFSLSEFTGTSTGLDNTPNDKQLRRIKNTAICGELVRSAIGNKPVLISSGFRSEKVNEKVGGSPTSAHKDGDAIDFAVAGMSTMDICRYIIRSGIKFDQLIAEDKNGKQWVHISFAPALRQQFLIYSKGQYSVGKI
jgi:zinc D-Ala-D-Ala carboxypeptidase